MVAHLHSPAGEAVHQGKRADFECFYAASEAVEHAVEGGPETAEAVVKDFDFDSGRRLVFERFENVASDFVVGDDEALEEDRMFCAVDFAEHFRIGRGSVAEEFNAVSRDCASAWNDAVERPGGNGSPLPGEGLDLFEIAGDVFVLFDFGEKIIRRVSHAFSDGASAAASGEEIENDSEDGESEDDHEPEQSPLRFIALIAQNVDGAEQFREDERSDPG